ncbi:hypothetical protein RF11_03328 [Thelohanellus kitauei]|uniref:Uncharacterized protein n=1 Tax=Thelohanellus kitauei TaxID=669202 RepID=A0A0C2MGK6_THEKT|nr:hypothetical protein RF11_03328 [Thelohanellus kitauei]
MATHLPSFDQGFIYNLELLILKILLFRILEAMYTENSFATGQSFAQDPIETEHDYINTDQKVFRLKETQRLRSFMATFTVGSATERHISNPPNEDSQVDDYLELYTDILENKDIFTKARYYATVDRC